jgi:hypothetical protein
MSNRSFKSYLDLEVWQLGMVIAKYIYQAAASFFAKARSDRQDAAWAASIARTSRKWMKADD